MSEHETAWMNGSVTMATADSESCIDSVDTVNNYSHQSVACGPCDDDTESCLQRLLALG